MSVSATTAAKRRRAGNIVSSPLFKPTNAPIENSIQRRAQPQPVQQTHQIPQQQTQQQTHQIPQQQTQQQTQQIPQHQTTNISQKPMSLQQVISVFDKRLLIIENKMINEQQTMNNSNSANIAQPTINNEQIQILIQNQMNEHISEFDHRYQMLATEITNLKQIVLKLQSYTLDVNKSLIEERVQILSDMKANVLIQPEDTLNLKEDIEEIEAHFGQRDTVNTDENITFSLNQNNDIKQELIQETVDDTIQEPFAEESLEEQITEPSEETLEEQIAEPSEESLEEQIAEPSEESLEEQIAEPTEESLEEQIAEPLEETSEEQIAEPSEETLEEQIAEPSEETLEEQIADPSEEVVADPSEEVVIDQITSESNAKPKRKRKNKKSIPVNV